MDHRRRDPTAPPPSDQSHIYPTVARSQLEPQYSPLVSVRTRAGMLSLRGAMPSDADAYVAYWHNSGERLKELLGIDRRKLGTPADTRERFFGMVHAAGTFPRHVIFTATLDDRVIGYTNMNRYGGNDNYAHLHLYRQSIRSLLRAQASPGGARAGAGLAAALIGPGLSMYFRLFPLRRLILQTRPQNGAINKALDLYLFPVERKYVEHPAGLAAAGEQCLRYVYRKDVPWMLRRGESLAQLDRAAAPVRADDLHLHLSGQPGGREEGTIQ